MHAPEQPSPGRLLPSSQASGGSRLMAPSPHAGGVTTMQFAGAFSRSHGLETGMGSSVTTPSLLLPPVPALTLPPVEPAILSSASKSPSDAGEHIVEPKARITIVGAAEKEKRGRRMTLNFPARRALGKPHPLFYPETASHG